MSSPSADAAVFTPGTHGSTTFTAGAPGSDTVQVTGTGGMLTDLTVTLHGLTNAQAGDTDIELIGPSGRSIALLSDACSGTAFTDATLTFDDDAAFPPQSGSCPSGSTYRTANYQPNGDTDAFLGSASGPLGVFDSTNPNGEWTVRLSDDTAGNTENGVLSGGFDLTITTGQFQALIPGTGTAGVSNPYPATLAPNNRTGTITDIDVALQGVSHTSIGDIDAIVVSPAGTAVWLTSDACGDVSETNVTWTFDDEAASTLPALGTVDSCDTDRYRPANHADADPESASLPAPAPAGPYGTSLSAFDGQNPNGTWRLFIVDDQDGPAGGGYVAGASLGIKTTSPVVSPASPISGVDTSSTVTVTLGGPTAPNTRFTVRPRRSTSHSAVLAFRSTAQAARFQCKSDRRAWHACPARVKLKRLSVGRHWFKVRSIDAAGNKDRSPARTAWRVLDPITLR